ncbi:thermonuclease family protein [Bacillus sporothermodurans]|nr:thermonuclease family protein [Heyndrickxia sporothermodurans]
MYVNRCILFDSYIDTPETKHPRIGVQPFGPEASNFTKKMLTNKSIELEMDVQERDKYGRLLAYIWLDGKMFNRILLEKGLARVAIFPPNTKYVDDFERIQDKARQKEIGIWSIENYATDRGFNSSGLPPVSSRSSKEHSSGCKIKGNINSRGKKIYHLPNGQYYQQTKAEAWFCSEKEAKEAGYRKSQR